MKLFITILSATLLLGCAQIESPTGGPKDEASPKIVKAIPEIGQTNFTDNELKVVFDEYVLLGNIAQEAIVSPPSEKEPEYKVNNKTLKIRFPEILQPNTTYTINLGEGIKDFHESVPLDSNVLVFSTGDYIDSLSFSGSVKNAFDLKPEEGILVLLFENSYDSVPSKERPYYYTKTDKDGRFEFQYLKSGQFSLFVLEDKDNDRLYNLPNERIGFLVDLINTSEVDSAYEVTLFEPDVKKQYVISLKESGDGKVTLILNSPASNVELNILGHTFKKEWYVSDTILSGDTIHIWTDLSRAEDKEYEVEINADGEVLDTVKLKLSAFDTLKPRVPNINLNVESGVAKYFESLILTTNTPIFSFLDSIKIAIGESDTTFVKVKKVGSKKILVQYKLEQDENYVLFVPDSFLTDVLGSASAKTAIEFRTKSDVAYGNLKLKVEMGTPSPVIMQFMTKGGAILKEFQFRTNSTFNLPNLSPGEYQLKLIFDTNENGKWTTGKYIPRTLPERVILYSEKLEMKEGWDKDITWIIPE